MHPVLFVLEFGGGSRVIGTYSLFLALGIATAGFTVLRATTRARLDVGAAIAGLAMVTGFGFAGAWLLFALVDVATTGNLDQVSRGGGLVFFGAVPGGALALWIVRRWLGLDVVRVLALSLPGVAAAHALGRFGCFLGGCCFGRPTHGPFGVVYQHPLAPASLPAGILRHPAPLYEAAGLLLLGFVFALTPTDDARGAKRIAAYAATYCGLRLFVETFRGDRVRGLFHGVSTSQWIALVGLLLAALAGRALTHRA